MLYLRGHYQRLFSFKTIFEIWQLQEQARKETVGSNPILLFSSLVFCVDSSFISSLFLSLLYSIAFPTPFTFYSTPFIFPHPNSRHSSISYPLLSIVVQTTPLTREYFFRRMLGAVKGKAKTKGIKRRGGGKRKGEDDEWKCVEIKPVRCNRIDTIASFSHLL